MYTSLSLEASFPIGIPEEYGIYGGVFLDTGSLWGLDNTDSGRIDDSSKIRSALGFSLFWESVIGPLRFNWSKPIKKEKYESVIKNLEPLTFSNNKIRLEQLRVLSLGKAYDQLNLAHSYPEKHQVLVHILIL